MKFARINILSKGITFFVICTFLISDFVTGAEVYAQSLMQTESTLAQEPGSTRLENATDTDREHEEEALALTSIAALLSERNAAEEGQKPDIEARIAVLAQKIDALYDGRFRNTVDYTQSVVDPDGGKLAIKVSDTQDGTESVVPYHIAPDGTLTRIDPRTISAFGEHDPEIARYVRSLLPNRKPLTDVLAPKGLAGLRDALGQIQPSTPLNLAGLADDLQDVDNFKDKNYIRALMEAVVVDDPQDRFLVVFVEDKPVFEERFLRFLVEYNLFDVIAQILRHEDLEPRLMQRLADAGLSAQYDAHDIVTRLQSAEVGPSVVGQVNRLHDIGLWYRSGVGILTDAQSVRHGRIIAALENMRRQAPALYAEATDAAAKSSAIVLPELLLSVDGTNLNVGQERWPARLSKQVRDAGISYKRFRQYVDLTWDGLMQFIVRTRLLAQIYTAKSQVSNLERLFLARRVVRVNKKPKAAVLDLDSLVNINYDDILNPQGELIMDANINLERVVVGVSKALAEKVNEAREAQGDLKFFVVSRRLPAWLLQGILDSIDAGDNNLLIPVAMPAGPGDLIESVQSKFDKPLDVRNDILFYLTDESSKAWKSELQDHKVIEVGKPAAQDQRVSIAKLLVGLEYLYMDPTESRPSSTVTEILRGILEQLYRDGGITAEEYGELMPLTDDDTQFILFPPTKADSLTGQVEDMLRTSQAVKKYA
ncbi:MAG: hypothetical protein Q8Q33_04155 [Chlamydiota bacterium]|nr:hypothetical protein [Chlamydiota bacterium]